MAENIKWLLDRESPTAKTLLWAHNDHVRAEPNEAFVPMGAASSKDVRK